jgi:hypothetical protein
MKAVTTRWISSLTVSELADFFRATSEEIFGSGARRLMSVVPGPGTSGKMKFFTPQPPDSPFAQFDAKPDFSVGVHGPQGGVLGGAQPVTVQMHVYDDRSARTVEFAAPYEGMRAPKGKASAHLQRFGDALKRADPSANESP